MSGILSLLKPQNGSQPQNGKCEGPPSESWVNTDQGASNANFACNHFTQPIYKIISPMHITEVTHFQGFLGSPGTNGFFLHTCQPGIFLSPSIDCALCAVPTPGSPLYSRGAEWVSATGGHWRPLPVTMQLAHLLLLTLASSTLLVSSQPIFFR
jgi:hypothetical protein